jgi:acyl-CoA reductase-like NAD-dependent aldehyde dehydrogenase
MSHPLQIFRAFDRSIFAEIPTDDAHAVERKLSAAARVFKDRSSWLKPHERGAILRRAAALLEARKDEFAVRIANEGGKPLKDALVEVLRAVDGLNNAADELRSFAGREVPMGMTAASEGRWAFTTKEPIGIVVAISAFNHPLNLIVHQVAPAIAVGCPVIVKPAATTPLSCLELIGIFREAGIPEPWCQTLITDDNELSELLATDSRVAFLSFIGSAPVGWRLRSKIAPGTRCSLEHGGSAPVIVDRSANLESVVEPLVKGGYYHAGQVCVSTQRIFVHEDLLADFIERFAARVEQLRVGDPLRSDTDVGPLIHPRESVRVNSWVEEAVANGANLLGGGRLSETTLLPAILISPQFHDKVSTLEIFGPVTNIYGFHDFDAAIDRANSLPFAFQASVFSTEIGPALRAAQRFDASTVLINDHTAFRTDWMPFAGRRQSGLGIGGIPWSMREMSQEKMIVLKQDV